MSSNICQSEFPQPISFKKPPEKETDDFEGWSSFILTASMTTAAAVVETEYIHRPLPSWNQSSSSSNLSIKSLEICTEGLGSESGSNIDELIDDFSNNNNTNNINNSVEKQSISLLQKSKKTNRNVIFFPPPLTSISGSETTRVRRYQESGRLVLKATSFSYSSFQAERANGRLRLYSIVDIDDEEKEDVDDDKDFEVNLSSSSSEDEMEMKNTENEKFLRTTNKSCKETGPGKTRMPISWGPHWVAIS